MTASILLMLAFVAVFLLGAVAAFQVVEEDGLKCALVVVVAIILIAFVVHARSAGV